MRLRNIKHITLSKAWAKLHRIEFDYKFKDGSWRTLSRETYNRGDGVAILLYNKEKRTTILTKQFRMPIYENTQEDAFSIEVCAGALDKNEAPLTCILREVTEETGYRIDQVEQVMSVYTSPGAVTEKLYLFLGEYNNDLKINEGGGAGHENEELDVIELKFEDALAMRDNGEIKDAKTILLLQYAQLSHIL